MNNIIIPILIILGLGAVVIYSAMAESSRQSRKEEKEDCRNQKEVEHHE